MWLESLAGFSFSRPVWLLALLPALALCWLAYQHAHRGSGWESILPSHLQLWLLRRLPGNANRSRYLLLAGCWLAAILALAGPSREVTAPATSASQPTVLIVLDVSHNMLSDDLQPTRLIRAKRKVRDILALPDDYQVGLIAYAGSAHRVTPLSNDPATLISLLQALEPAIMPSSGRDLDQALTLARDSISELPRSIRVLVLTSGADETELAALEQHAAALGAQLAVLGVGTAEGAPVALEKGGFMRDDQGRILLPRLNARALASTVRRHGGSYHGMTLDDRDLQRVLPTVGPSSQASGAAGDDEPIRSIRDYGAWLALLLVPLAALGARRGWLGLLVCAALLPMPADADWADYWQRADQQGAALLEQDQPRAAAERFEDPAWRAWAWYQAEDYAQAADAYAEQLERRPDDADSHFNFGTALAMSGRYPEALEAFEQALTRNPEHHPARHNRDRIEALLEEQKRQQAEQNAETDENETAETRPDQASSGETPQSSPTDTPDDGESQSEPTPDSNSEAEHAAGTAPGAQPGESSDTAQDGQNDAGSPGDANAATDASEEVDNEQQQALDQWLEAIPDEPAELLRRKFLYQYQQRKEAQP